MSLFGIFSSKAKRFVSDDAFRANLAKQVSMVPLTMAQLRRHGVSDASLLKLEFFFYTNDSLKAAALSSKLAARGYSSNRGSSSRDKKIHIINGWTDKIQMSDVVVTRWTEEMCELGFADDCDFDGWGTNPQQAA